MRYGQKEVSFFGILMFILRPDALSLNGSIMIINQSINQSVLDLGNNPINDHVMISFGDPLSNKCRLRNLKGWTLTMTPRAVETSDSLYNITPDGFSAFTHIFATAQAS